MKTVSVVLCLGILSFGSATAEAQPHGANVAPQQKPGKPQRVVDLKNGSFVIDASGDWVLNRSWRLELQADMPFSVIDVVADNVVLDFRGFSVDVETTSGFAPITVINVQGDSFTLKNAVVSSGSDDENTLLHSTGDRTTLESVTASSRRGITLEGSLASIRNSVLEVRSGVSLSSTGTIENTVVVCNVRCVGFAGDQNKLLNSRIQPAQFTGITIGGNGNLLAGNVLDFPATGPELQTGFLVEGDANVLRNNTLMTGGETFVAMRVSGTANVIDGNVGAALDFGSILTGIRFEQNGNFYGDNRMDTAIPFDLGGTTQTDWGGNVGY